jgi:hypothetical protein
LEAGTTRILRSRALPSAVFARPGESDSWPPACCADNVGDAGELRRGIPRAEARLLAIDDESLCNCRLCPGSLGGCCGKSPACVDCETPDTALDAEDSTWPVLWCDVKGEVVVERSGDVGRVGCSC